MRHLMSLILILSLAACAPALSPQEQAAANERDVLRLVQISLTDRLRPQLEASYRQQVISVLPAEPPPSEAAGRIVEGKRVIEVVPALLPDKDAAFARLVKEHQLRGAVFMGDDGADAAVFRAIAARQHAGLEALAVAVIDPETPPSLIESAGVTLDGVDAVEAFLDALATALETGAKPGVAS